MKYKIVKKLLVCALCAVFIGVSVRADVTVRTASGQEVELTDSQWSLIEEYLTYLVDFTELNTLLLENFNQGQSYHSYILKSFLSYDDFWKNFAATNSILNLTELNVVYTNFLAAYLANYTNNLYSHISALDTSIFSTNFLRNSGSVEEWLVSRYAPFDIYRSITGLSSLFSNYQGQFLGRWWILGLQDSNTLSTAYSEYNSMINGEGEDQSLPLDIQIQQGIIGMQQFQYMYAQNQDYIDRVTAGFTLGMFDSSTGQVVPFGSPYFDNRFNDDYLGFVQNDFLNGRSFTAVFQEGTNLLERISRSNVPDTVKQKMSDNIIQKLIQANTLQGKNDFEGLKDALQGMAEAMSNCCSNTGFLPLIYDGVSNLVEGVGNNQIGGGAGGSDSNGLANLEFPLGFPPSETNIVPYSTEWVQYYLNNAAFDNLSDVRYALNRNNQDEHNRKAENVGSNITHRVVPIIDKFRTYSQGFSRATPPQNILIIDTSPISSFARYLANTDVDFGFEGGILDLTWINEKICIPFHKFFTIFWVSLAAFLIISSWIFFFRKFMSFRVYFIKLWDVFKNVFK